MSQRYNVLHFELIGGSWLQTGTVYFEPTPIRSVSGRLEGGFFSVYAVSATKLYRYTTLDNSIATLAVAPAGMLRANAHPPTPVSCATL